MTLQILVAQYKEPESVVRRLLSSIALQQGVDFEDMGVIIANDGSEVLLSEDFLSAWPFSCRYVKLPHGGISATRNALLRHASADFVMLCDADDMFTDAFALYYILSGIRKAPDTELFSYNFAEELKNRAGRSFFQEHPRDLFCIHGKIFNRAWLDENGIRYADSQYCFGDTYFVGLAIRLAAKKSYCDKAIYLWKHNPASISRSSDYFITRFDMKLKSDELLIDELLNRRREADARNVALLTLYEAYYMTTQSQWAEAQSAGQRGYTEALLRRLLAKYAGLYAACDRAEHARALGVVSNNYVRNLLPPPNRSFGDWLNDYRL